VFYNKLYSIQLYNGWRSLEFLCRPKHRIFAIIIIARDRDYNIYLFRFLYDRIILAHLTFIVIRWPSGHSGVVPSGHRADCGTRTTVKYGRETQKCPLGPTVSGTRYQAPGTVPFVELRTAFYQLVGPAWFLLFWSFRSRLVCMISTRKVLRVTGVAGCQRCMST